MSTFLYFVGVGVVQISAEEGGARFGVHENDGEHWVRGCVGEKDCAWPGDNCGCDGVPNRPCWVCRRSSSSISDIFRFPGEVFVAARGAFRGLSPPAFALWTCFNRSINDIPFPVPISSSSLSNSSVSSSPIIVILALLVPETGVKKSRILRSVCGVNSPFPLSSLSPKDILDRFDGVVGPFIPASAVEASVSDPEFKSTTIFSLTSASFAQRKKLHRWFAFCCGCRHVQNHLP